MIQRRLIAVRINCMPQQTQRARRTPLVSLCLRPGRWRVARQVAIIGDAGMAGAPLPGVITPMHCLRMSRPVKSGNIAAIWRG
jgi:hypothetical protein